MTGPEHLAKAATYVTAYDKMAPEAMDLAHCIGLAVALGAALVHAIIAHTLATVSDENGNALAEWELP